MSLKTLRRINVVAGLVLLPVLVVGAWFAVGALSGLVHSSLVTAVLFWAGLLLIPLTVLVLRSRSKAVPGSKRQLAFLLVGRGHNTRPMDQSDGLSKLGELGVTSPTLVQAFICSDCGHNEFVLRDPRGQMFVVYSGAEVSDVTSWTFGLTAVWQRTRTIPYQLS